MAAPIARSAPVTALRRRRILAAAVTASLLIALLVALGGLVAARHLTAGASACTSQCQASERIRGSLPVPPDPMNPTPIG